MIDTKKFGKVAVLMGGPSAERPVSLRSGNAVLEALKRQGVDAHGIDPDANFLNIMRDGEFDRAFIALHGRFGEDGVVQGALESIQIPYTGSGVLGSALGMDKLRSSYVWKAGGIPVPESVVLTPDTDFDAVVKKLGLPIFVKPAREGSSIGVTKVKRAEDLPAAFKAAVAYDSIVLAERAINGPDITCGIVGKHVLPLIRVEIGTEFFTYEAKYQRSDTVYHCPSGLAPDLEKRIQALAVKAFELLDCRGWGRVDFMLDEKTNSPYALEVNTAPGMTGTSLMPRAAKTFGWSFDDLVLHIMEASYESR